MKWVYAKKNSYNFGLYLCRDYNMASMAEVKWSANDSSYSRKVGVYFFKSIPANNRGKR